MSVVKAVCMAMERIAPLRLAAKWDNVGLLLEAPYQKPNARNILLTIDLTPSVVEEALNSTPWPTSVIVSYHPPIFKPLSSLTLANPLQSSLLRCATNGISVYSPHTALDFVLDGVNDWLASGVLSGPGYSLGGQVRTLAGDKIDLEAGAGGEGRLVTLPEPVALAELEKRVMKHLGLSQIQVGFASSTGNDSPSNIRTVAICAGSGGSVLMGHPADVYLTGEMSHHDVLAAVAAGTHVILCGHTNTERGYLPTLAHMLQRELAREMEDSKEIDICISQQDKHPLQIVRKGD